MADHSSRSKDAKHEREFRRYADAVLGICAPKDGDPAVSSNDVPLTAFAQLVALRLNAKRVLVSLFDHASQYILAEATQTLSLQQDQDHSDQDAMFFGTTTLPRSNDWHSETLRIARKTSRVKEGGEIENTVVVLPDLLSDERYVTHQHVAGAPFIRSFIGVPLMGPTGYAVGTLTLLDDKPRIGDVTTSDIKIMQDVATSIMTHLELARIQTIYTRGLRMVQGLSCFIEGKDSLEDDDTHVGEDLNQLVRRQLVQSDTLGGSARTHALNTASNAERVDRVREALFDNSLSRAGGALPCEGPKLRPKTSTAIRTKPPASVSVAQHRPRQTQNSTRPATASQLEEYAVSEDVMQAFGRAAHLIQDSMDLAGVVFLDASAGAFGSLKAPVAENMSAHGSGSVSLGTVSDSEQSRQDASTSQRNEPRAKICRYLAAAYASDVNGQAIIDHKDISEKFLGSLLKRFPHGKIYNFGQDGLLSSSGGDFSDSGYSGSGSVEAANGHHYGTMPCRRKPRRRYSDSVKLQKIFPGLRSFALIPLWDEQKSRFLAGAIIWSYSPARLFSFQGDLNYVSAFCDVLMAETGRIAVQADARAKTNFISSISHELRSPLHGILGSVEFLQEEGIDATSRQEMTKMIDLCGRSLLDIVNNLLEHAHASSAGQTGRLGRNWEDRVAPPMSSAEAAHDIALLAEEVLQSTLWNTPSPSTRPTGNSEQESTENEVPLKVILDLDQCNLPPSGWEFHVNAGGLRRILQNLAGNAIKYTDNGGFFKCRISMEKGSLHTRASRVQIDCSDSGRGMSESYLKNGLWQAFQQEDSHASGTGLGLSLVKTLVEDMEGSINVSSTKGVGTSVKISLPLTPATSTETNFLSSTEAKLTRGLFCCLVGFDTTPDQRARSSESTTMVRESLEKMCRYLSLRVSEERPRSASEAHVYLISEREALAISGSAASAQERYRTSPCVVLCDSVSSSRRTATAIGRFMTKATVISQPVGPSSLLRAVTSCLTNLPNAGHINMAKAVPQETIASDASDMPMNKKTAVSWVHIEPVSGHSSDSTPATEDFQPRELPEALRRRPLLHPQKSAILLVDDNPVNLVLLQKYMEKLKRHHVGAVNGLEALEKYRMAHSSATDHESMSGADLSSSSDDAAAQNRSTPAHPVSVVFMDITMPVMDGLESTRRIRALERTLRLKPAIIVALTALASPQARQEAYGSGVDIFLTKPVRFSQIEQMFKDWDADLRASDSSN